MTEILQLREIVAVIKKMKRKEMWEKIFNLITIDTVITIFINNIGIGFFYLILHSPKQELWSPPPPPSSEWQDKKKQDNMGLNSDYFVAVMV